ncbi:MAG: hypothetical protein JWM12_1223 [Ilumatobacteraceae bacterium]|nr:hypothetical protein [Ilumatobacteraceae bacterium]
MTIRTRDSRVALVVISCAAAVLGPVMLPSVAAAPPRRGGDALPPSPADPAHPITDPALVADMATATSRHTEGTPQPRVAIEVLTSYDREVGDEIAALGGTVTGSVPGAVVQASVPVDRAGAVARARGVEFVQAPREVNQRPRDVEAGFGGVVNDGVVGMNAAAWQDAGIRGGGVRVGIVDFFRMAQWNPAEQGPVPTVANGHMRCLDSLGTRLCNPDGSINSDQGDVHGLAVTEILKDTAPDADVFIASVATVSDLRTAIDWFAANGVTIITRSLGSAFDGPGDGTGPLDTVVDYAASLGLVWFNSAGNDSGTGYMRVGVSATEPDGSVDFAPGDNLLRLLGDGNGCFELDGIRWANDWYLPPNQRTDYRVEVYQPTGAAAAGGLHDNPAQLLPVDLAPSAPGVQSVADASQRGGAEPLELADSFWCTPTGVSYLRIVRNPGTPIGATPDQIEIASTLRDLEYDSPAAGSAAKPVVDSASHSLLAVGALDSATASTVAFYSSQGPTNDGRVKPDLVAPSCVDGSVYGPCFAGTSASSPAAAGAAALVLSAGLAAPGEPLAALVRHFTVDLGAPGPDNASGYGKLVLPAPPVAAAAATPAAFTAISPVRILDTRTISPVGPANLIGVQPERGILDLGVTGSNGVPATGVAAVAVNITSVDSLTTHYIQALPTMQGTFGTTSTLNVSTLGQPRPNFAIVPVGQGGRITLYMPTGGNVIVDLLGYFAPAEAAAAAAGRFVPIQPERWMDTRVPGPFPAGVAGSRRVSAGETVTVAKLPGSAVPTAGVSALVLNVTADDAAAPGFLRAIPTGAQGLNDSTVNYVPGTPSANTAIVPVGGDGTISVFSYASTHAIVDVVGFITDGSAPVASQGLFVALSPARFYDSRSAGPPFAAGSTRDVALVGGVVPADALAVSANLTADQGAAVGFVKVDPAGTPATSTSNLNFARNAPVANAGLLKLGAGGAVSVFVNQQVHVIIDINGYFTGT